ncbi:hypothetical protein KY284_001190 [Solanum tuberosum]|nr:hypothetical protein KY284_001190 [Solanum tuberosum]
MGETNVFQEQRRKYGHIKGAIMYVSIWKFIKGKRGEEWGRQINEDEFFEAAKENHKGILDEKNENPKTPIGSKAEENLADAHSGVGESTKRSNRDHNYSLSSIQLTNTKGERKHTTEEKRKEVEEGPHEAQEEGQTGYFDRQNQVNINETTKAPEIDKMTHQEKRGRQDRDED